jgi:hypothetical protein
MVLGVFGAAAGSWLGERTLADLPSNAGALRLLNAAVAAPDAAASFSHRFSMSGRADALSSSVLPRAQRRDGKPPWALEEARDGLLAAGWTITEFTIHPHQASVICTTDERLGPDGKSCSFESRYATLTAERDGLILRGSATDYLADETGNAWVGGIDGILFVARGAAYLPLTVAGGLLGALAGWLLTAALAYRIRSRSPGSGRLAAAFAGVAMTTSAPPVWAITVNAVMLGEHLTDIGPLYALHSALRPASHLDGPPPWLIPGCALAATAAAAIAVGILILGADRKEPPAPPLTAVREPSR